MKINIDGNEIPLFETFTENDLKKIKQIIIKFHSPYNMSIQKMLAKTHWLVHLHPSNQSNTIITSDNCVIPSIYECTYIRKYGNENLMPNKLELPHILDQPNIPSKKDLKLIGYPYIN